MESMIRLEGEEELYYLHKILIPTSLVHPVFVTYTPLNRREFFSYFGKEFWFFMKIFSTLRSLLIYYDFQNPFGYRRL